MTSAPAALDMDAHVTVFIEDQLRALVVGTLEDFDDKFRCRLIRLFRADDAQVKQSTFAINHLTGAHLSPAWQHLQTIATIETTLVVAIN